MTAEPTSRALPVSKRGIRTRAALVAGAREVFERDGYLDARIADVSEAAGVAAGSFYTYFTSKEAVFAAVVEEVQDDMLHPHIGEYVPDDDITGIISASNRAYMLAYKRNARMMGVFEQVAGIDEEFRAMRRRRGQAFVKRNARTIRELQGAGLVDAELDADIAARALSAMVARVAYQVFVIGERVPFERLLRTLDRLWVNALQIPPGAKVG